MKKTLMIAMSTLLAGAPLAQAAEPAWYGSLNLGMAFPEGSLSHEGANGAPSYDADNGVVLGLGAGYAFGNGLRLEGELRGRRFDVDGRSAGGGGRFGGPSHLDGRAESTTLMANIAYDFVLKNTKLRPYLKGGLGVARNKLDADLYGGQGIGGPRQYSDGTSNQFAWSLGAGAAYPVNDRMSLTAEYQYIDLGSAETNTDIHGRSMGFDDLGSHEVTLGVRYEF